MCAQACGGAAQSPDVAAQPQDLAPHGEAAPQNSPAEGLLSATTAVGAESVRQGSTNAALDVASTAITALRPRKSDARPTAHSATSRAQCVGMLRRCAPFALAVLFGVLVATFAVRFSFDELRVLLEIEQKSTRK